MKNTIKLSTVALLAAIMTGSPAGAVSLNLGGGGPVVDLGNSSNTGATVSVDTGGNGGTDTPLASLDVNTGSSGNNGLIDLGGNGDLIDLGGNGDLIDLGGNTSVDALLDLGSTGDGDLLDLGGNGDLIDLGDDFLLDLGGTDDELVALDLGNTNADVDINLGSGAAPLAAVTVGTGGSTPVPGADVSVTIGGGAGSGGNGGAGGSGGNGSGITGTGGVSDSGDTGGGSSGGGGFASIGGGDGAKCLSLSAAQIDELIKRHAYTRATFNSWAGARSLKIVEVEFCDGIDAKVDAVAMADGNIDRLQAFLRAQAKINAGLKSRGHTADDVIAVDKSGTTLIVYVI